MPCNLVLQLSSSSVLTTSSMREPKRGTAAPNRPTRRLESGAVCGLSEWVIHAPDIALSGLHGRAPASTFTGTSMVCSSSCEQCEAFSLALALSPDSCPSLSCPPLLAFLRACRAPRDTLCNAPSTSPTCFHLYGEKPVPHTGVRTDAHRGEQLTAARIAGVVWDAAPVNANAAAARKHRVAPRARTRVTDASQMWSPSA